jgi:hypothetical protein
MMLATLLNGKAVFLLRIDERRQIVHIVAGRVQLWRARHEGDALDRSD